MATNFRDSGAVVTLKAAAERTSGKPAVDENIAGVPQVTVAAEKRYASKVAGNVELTFIAESVKGDRVDINDTTMALTRVAYGGAIQAGTRPFATVTAVPGDGETADANQAPITGKMWAKLLPQQIKTGP
jgi:hypothetical protein